MPEQNDNVRTDWFESWFDSPYYHSLYANRNDEEAAFFLDHLVDFLQPGGSARFLDAACGKGRHSKYLHDKGFDVLGFDLSIASIEEAQQMAEEGLQFERKDIRKIDYEAEFDYVLNLFTSFGYFDTAEEDQAIVDGFAQALKPGGTVVIDYLNPHWVKDTLTEYEEKEVEGITYEMQRSIEKGIVKKHIRFRHEGEFFEFTEQVKLFELSDFQHLLEKAGLRLSHAKGDYKLDDYQREDSPRLIIFADKPA